MGLILCNCSKVYYLELFRQSCHTHFGKSYISIINRTSLHLWLVPKRKQISRPVMLSTLTCFHYLRTRIKLSHCYCEIQEHECSSIASYVSECHCNYLVVFMVFTVTHQDRCPLHDGADVSIIG